VSRIVVTGIGTPTFVAADRHFGPGRRTTHFAFALADAGHDVTVLWIADDGSAETAATRFSTPRGASLEARAVSVHAFADGRVRRFLDELAPSAVVGAAVHASAQLARAAAPGTPLWADVFGDPMAEAQAKAAADGDDSSLATFWDALAVVLARGDRFSAVSVAQSHALVGQLGLAGRLSGSVIGDDLVAVIPCAAEPASDSSYACTHEPALPGLRGERVPHDSFVALFTGSFNTWCDVGTMVSGVERAMDLDEKLRFVATGGAIPGHHSATARDVERRIATSRHRARFHLLGWIPSIRLRGLYLESDVGLNIERAIYERHFGAENRVTEWMAYGVPAITTGQSELGRFLVERGLAFGVRPGDAEDLGRTLVYLARDRERLRTTALACKGDAARRATFAVTARPLLEWCEAPVSRPLDRRPARLALVSDPRALSGLLEQYVATLGPAELGYRSVRWIWRRVARRLANHRPT
jgi:glycosyltransferase involved in cell wall biosynthesis